MDTLKSTSIFLPLVVTSVICFASLSIYRLFLHPLAKFPGPKLAAITRYYEAYYDVVQNGQYTFRIAAMHKEYGPIVRISPYELHVSDPRFFEKLYRQDGIWNKYDWTYVAFSAKYASVCTPSHEIHKRRRAPLNHFFSKATVASRQSIIQAQVDKLCNRINEYVGSASSLNLGTAISAFTVDIATEFVLGKGYNNLDRQDFNADMTNIFQSSGAIWRVTKHIRWFGPTMKLLPLDFVEKMGDNSSKAFFAFLKDTMQTIQDIISANSSPGPDPKAPRTIVHEILQSNLPPAEKTVARINDEVGTITGAAFETTAQTLRVILYYVYSNAKILQRLRAELKESAKRTDSTQEAQLSVLEQLPYLTAVLTEGLRLSPGIATRMARIAPDRELVYGEWVIPAGTPVGMTTLLMHMDESLYPDPKRFDPERWTDIDRRKKCEKTYAPFSRGTRICLGMQLAWAELYLTLAALVRRFDFKFDGTGPKDIECVSDQFIIGTKDQNGLKVYVTLHEG